MSFMSVTQYVLCHQRDPWYDRGMTRKIGVSLRDDLYEWAAREVTEGRAESVSALIAHGLEVLRSRSELAELVRDLEAEIGEVDEETKARAEDALRAAEEAQRRHLANGKEPGA
jgi:Arc/MetJ-type ribon-helix-helix transcriptional regulator